MKKDLAKQLNELNDDLCSLIMTIEENYIKPICNKYYLDFQSEDDASYWRFSSIDTWITTIDSAYFVNSKSFMTKEDYKHLLDLIKILDTPIGKFVVGFYVKNYSPVI